MPLMSLLLFTFAALTQPQPAATVPAPPVGVASPKGIPLQPTSIQEREDDFLSLWPHRWDYLWAEHPAPGEKPDWHTQNDHPLSDRLILQGAYLYGVRFGPQTNYLMIDIDITSAYHPAQDPLAIERLQAALEPLGLVRPLICTSSDSQGLHLYYPFQEAQSSWQLSAGVAALLESKGFKLAPGQLEIFPNPKPYASDGPLSLYNGHRLPMQAGSYLLDGDLVPFPSDTDTFAARWRLVQPQNDINQAVLEQMLKQFKRQRYQLSTSASSFLNDLNAEIEMGWTGAGQTNDLIGRIAIREYVFGHIIDEPEPLQGQALIDKIVAVAVALPGYEGFCNHKDEIEKRAADWARSVQRCPRYYPYRSTRSSASPATGESENQRRAREARQRICNALADLEERGALPAGITARAQALAACGISLETLYKHQELWHPNRLLKEDSEQLHPIAELEVAQSEPSMTEPALRTATDKKLSLSVEADAPQARSASTATNETGGSGGNFHNPDAEQSLSAAQQENQLPEIVDFAGVLYQIQQEKARLGWSPQTITRHLQEQFGKATQSRLDDRSLMGWLHYLQEAT